MNNFANRFLLWCFLLPSGIYRGLGADITQLKAILITKLTIDDRTATGLYKARNRNKDEDTSLATVITMVIALVMGIMFSFVFVIEDDLNRFTMYFTILGFMLAMFLITDFSHILIDVKDNYIILPKPVSSQTFLLARLLHIIIHVTKILLPMALPGLIGTWISRGLWGAVVFIPVMLLLTIMTFVMVNAVYLMIMRVFTPAKINSIITTLQIVFSIILYGGFQLLSRIVGESFLEEIQLSQYSWIWIFPGFWLAAGWSYAYSFVADPVYILGAILSVVVPIAGLWLMIKFLAPAFFRKLSMISAGGGGDEQKQSQKTKQQNTSGLLPKLSNIFTQKGVERESFLFTWRMTSRNRDFKLKVYPQVGYIIILLIVFLFRHVTDIEVGEDGLIASQARGIILSTIYVSSILFMGAIYQISYYDQFKASWIYYSPPLSSPGLIISGAIRAILVKFFLTVVVLLTIMGVALFGIELLPNLICGLGNVFLLCMIYAWAVMDKLPFSVSQKNSAQGQVALRNILMLIGLPLFGVPHYFLFNFPWVVSIIAVLTITTGFFVLQRTRNISWGYMKEA